jgi:eukaryotic-like serine/threonine-protein kinase
MSADTTRVRALFRCALHLPPAERSVFLGLACRSDAVLRSRLDELFAASARADGFLEDRSRFPTPIPDSLPGARRIGPYTLGRLLGEGGMGVVWSAEQDEPIRRTVALKVVKAGMDSAAVLTRFEQEQQVLARMNHPNIAHVLDAGETEDGRPYFVMELVDGVPIAPYCDGRGLPLRDRLELFAQVCFAVQHAHQKGVIHRDLKPSNVLVSQVDGRPVPKVIDFGIAKALGDVPGEASPTVVSLGVLGTIEYMAPEQAEPGRTDVDTRADVYSLGALLYELLAGRPPLSADEVRPLPFAEALRRVREDIPPRPSARLTGGPSGTRLGATLRHELDWVVMKALEKDRERRYATASELAADVRRYLDDEPVTARPPGRGYRLRKFVRRNRWPVAAATLVSLAVVCGAGVATAGWVAASRAEQDAETARADAVEQRRVAEERADSEARSATTARSAAKTTEDVLDYVGRFVFSAGGPVGMVASRGRDSNLRQLLDLAVAATAKEFAGRPAIEARVRHWIGQSYLLLGEPARAIEQLLLVARLDESHPPADPAVPHLVSVHLATAYLFDGRIADAMNLLAKATPAAVAQMGSDHAVALAARAALGMAYDLDGRSAEAIGVLEPVVSESTRVRGRRHLDTRLATNLLALAYSHVGREKEADRLIQSIANDPEDLNALRVAASVHHRAGRPDRAAELLRRLLPLCEVKFGPRHPSTLEAMVSLGASYVESGRAADGIGHLETARARIDDALGRDHPLALVATADLADGYLQIGQAARAAALLEAVVPRFRERFGPAHPDTLAATTNLALAYNRLGRAREGVALLKKSIPTATAALGPKHPIVLGAQVGLATTLTGSGQPAEAIELLKTADATRRDVLSTSHPIAIGIRIQMAKANERLGRPEEAVRLMQEVVKVRTAVSGPTHPDTLIAAISLASAHARAGRPAEAIGLLEKLVPACRARFGEMHLDSLNATSALAGAYMQAGRRKEAAELIERLYPEYVEVLGLRHPDTLTAAANLAHVYRQTGRIEKAVELLATFVPLFREVHGKDHPETLTAESVLAISYTDVGRGGEAARLLEHVVEVRRKDIGADHPKTVIAESNLALAFEQSRRKEALSALEKVLPACVARLGPTDISTLNVKGALAREFARAGRYKEAAALRDELLPIIRSKFGKDHPAALRILLARAEGYGLEGRRSDAAAAVTEFLRQASDAHAKDPRALAAARAAAGRVLLSVGEFAAAEPVLRACLANVREADRAPGLVPPAETLLGFAILGQGKFDEAERLLLSGYRGLAERADPPTGPWPGPADAAGRLADIYEVSGEPELARSWRARAGTPVTELGPQPRPADR